MIFVRLLKKNLNESPLCKKKVVSIKKECKSSIFHSKTDSKSVETYQLERENKQLKSEIQYLNDELDSSKVLSSQPQPFH